MTAWLADLGAPGTLLALLFLGHTLGDFVLQTPRMVANKGKPSVLGLHGLLVTLVTALALLPFLSVAALVVVATLGVAHVIIDMAKQIALGRWGRPVTIFLTDQVLHGVTLLAAWWALTRPAWMVAPSLPGWGLIGDPLLVWITRGAVVAGVLAFNHHGANAIVRGLLPDPYRIGQEDEVRTGRVIGTLERYLVLLLAVFGQWGAIALVVAVKSIARFEELKQRTFAEYYLVGTLSSMLIAVVSGLLVGVLI